MIYKNFLSSFSLAVLFAFNVPALYAEEAPSPEKIPEFESKISPVPAELMAKMKQTAWKEGCPVALDKLSYVQLSYWGLDHKRHKGELIVNSKLAPELIDIFKELYDGQFPIEKMQLMENFKGDDTAAMGANNSSAFNCREIEGKPGSYSVHSYGAAVDINTVINPFVGDKEGVLPKDGRHFVDREQDVPGLIRKDDLVYKAFTKRGWTWGGDWVGDKDLPAL